MSEIGTHSKVRRPTMAFALPTLNPFRHQIRETLGRYGIHVHVPRTDAGIAIVVDGGLPENTKLPAIFHKIISECRALREVKIDLMEFHLFEDEWILAYKICSPELKAMMDEVAKSCRRCGVRSTPQETDSFLNIKLVKRFHPWGFDDAKRIIEEMEDRPTSIVVQEIAVYLPQKGGGLYSHVRHRL